MTFVICLHNEGYEASLELRKIYQLLPPEPNDLRRYIRIVDDSGEDYLYNAKAFDCPTPAAHIPGWAIAHVENGFISTEELVETVGHVRKVDAIYSKDFSDLLGVRATIVTASG